MGQMNAGLPQPVGSSKLPVGSTMAFATGLGGLLVLSDGTEWLETGKAVSYEPKYAAAAKLDHLKVFGGRAVVLPSASYGTCTAATDGAGTVLITKGNTSSTNIARSTDGGKTFTDEPITVTNQIHSVIWAGNRFVVIAGNATTLYAYHSTTGASGTWTTGTSLTGLATSSQVVDIRAGYNPATGTILLTRPGAATNNVVYRCTTGSTFTAVTMPTATLYPAIACSPTRWVYHDNNANVLYYSDNDGVTWNTGTSPAFMGTGQTPTLVCINGAWLFRDASYTFNTYQYSLTGIGAWTLKSGGGDGNNQQLTLDRLVKLSADGTKLYAGCDLGGFYWTVDGLRWYRHWTDVQPTTRGIVVVDLGAFGLLVINGYSSSTVGGWSANVAAPDYVGIMNPMPLEGASAIVFVRVS